MPFEKTRSGPREVGNCKRLVVLIFALAGMYYGVKGDVQQVKSNVVLIETQVTGMRNHLSHIDNYLEKSSRGDYTTPDPSDH